MNELAIAVLPFANLSVDPESRYFSDGIADEVIAALVRSGALAVVAPTSSFKLRFDKPDLSLVTEKLGVTHVVEGSVRKVGDQVRIAVRLVEAASQAHVFSEQYERNYSEVFNLPDDIALKIIDRLVPGEKDAASRLAGQGRTSNRLAFEDYLKARRHYPFEMNRCTPYLRDAVELDADYAPAHALLAQADLVESAFETAEKHMREALRVDPDNATALAVRAGIFVHRLNRVAEGINDLASVISREGFNVEALEWSAAFLEYAGVFELAGKLRQRLARVDPLNEIHKCAWARDLVALGSLDEAEKILAEVTATNGGVEAHADLAQLKMSRGDEAGYEEQMSLAEEKIETRSQNRLLAIRRLEVAVLEEDLEAIEEFKQWIPDSLAAEPDLFHAMQYYYAIEDERYFDVLAQAVARGHRSRFLPRVLDRRSEQLGFAISFWQDERVDRHLDEVGLGETDVARIDLGRWSGLAS